jgi:hypothetical protein
MGMLFREWRGHSPASFRRSAVVGRGISSAPDGNLTVNTPGQIDINGAGTLLFQSSTSAGDNRIFQYRTGRRSSCWSSQRPRALASTIDGRIVRA